MSTINNNINSASTSVSNSYKNTVASDGKNLESDIKFYDITQKARQSRAEQLAKEKQEEAKTKQSGLGKDAFMQLFIAQLKNQDPMEPLKNEQFISQMSQLSSVEQLSNLNSQFSKFMEKFDSFDKIGEIGTAIDNLSEKLNSFDKMGNFGEAVEKLTSKIDTLDNKSEFNKFMELYENTSSNLLNKIASLENEIKNLKQL